MKILGVRAQFRYFREILSDHCKDVALGWCVWWTHYADWCLYLPIQFCYWPTIQMSHRTSIQRFPTEKPWSVISVEWHRESCRNKSGRAMVMISMALWILQIMISLRGRMEIMAVSDSEYGISEEQVPVRVSFHWPHRPPCKSGWEIRNGQNGIIAEMHITNCVV